MLVFEFNWAEPVDDTAVELLESETTPQLDEFSLPALLNVTFVPDDANA